MVHIAWLGKKSPFCGNVSYGNSTTEELKNRGHKISFIHFDNPSSLDVLRNLLPMTISDFFLLITSNISNTKEG